MEGNGGAGLDRPLLGAGGKQSQAEEHVAIGMAPAALASRASVDAAVVPITLETRSLDYFLPGDSGKEVRILKDVSLRFGSGVLTAVMGYARGI